MNVEPWSDRITRGGLLDLHAESIRRFGGDTSPDAQEGCLERSLGAAWNAELYSNEPDAVSGLCFAGCLLFYLIMNHCFVDGNKRVAWAACMECLRTLGLTVNVTDDEAEQYCFSVIRRDVKNATDVSLWLAPKLEAFEA